MDNWLDRIVEDLFSQPAPEARPLERGRMMVTRRDRWLWSLSCRFRLWSDRIGDYATPHWSECPYCGHLHHTLHDHLPDGHCLVGYCDGCVQAFTRMVNQ